MTASDLAKALSAAAISADRFTIESKWHAPDVPAFEPGTAHAGFHSLDDQITLEFCDRSDDHDQGAAQRAACVDLFAERDELDCETAQFVEDFEEMLYRTGDPIAGPDQDDIELAAAAI